jgi:hypothetical protein
MTASLLYFELKVIHRLHIVNKGMDFDKHLRGGITEGSASRDIPQSIGRYLALSGKELGPVKLSHNCVLSLKHKFSVLIGVFSRKRYPKEGGRRLRENPERGRIAEDVEHGNAWQPASCLSGVRSPNRWRSRPQNLEFELLSANKIP